MRLNWNHCFEDWNAFNLAFMFWILESNYAVGYWHTVCHWSVAILTRSCHLFPIRVSSCPRPRRLPLFTLSRPFAPLALFISGFRVEFSWINYSNINFDNSSQDFVKFSSFNQSARNTRGKSRTKVPYLAKQYCTATTVITREKQRTYCNFRWLWKINVVSLVLGEFASLGLFFVAYFPQDIRYKVVYWVHICAAMVNFSTG